MTYLSCPRLHFSGRFFADPSTVNNESRHYESVTFDRASAWKPDSEGGDGLWNPGGRHHFRFEDVTVGSAVGTDGAPTTGDPVVGLRLAPAGTTAAKLVDLDVDQQLVSTIFGLDLQLVDDDDNILVRGLMEPVAFSDFWVRGTGPTDSSFAAVYQSRLSVTEWGDLSASPFLTQLRAATAGDLLSIKFNVHDYSMDPGPGFARGRIVGTVGVAVAGEPAHLVVGRQFGRLRVAGFNRFPGVVDTAAGKIRLDLGNGLTEVTSQSPDLRLGYQADDGTIEEIAPIDYRKPDWYKTTAGIVDLPADRALTAAETTRVKKHPLMLFTPVNGQPRALVEETSVHVRAEEFVARLDPGQQWTVRFLVTERGEPLPNKTVALTMQLPTDDAGNVPPDVDANFPRGGLTFDTSVTTHGDGIAVVTFTAGDPGNPRFAHFDATRRVNVDGQVYLVNYQVEGLAPTRGNQLSVLVWNRFAPDSPAATWTGSIGAIFTRYGDLYPAMTNLPPKLDLADYEQVAARRVPIARALRRDMADPRYMPVTRDLSGSRKKALLDWLENLGADGKPLFTALGGAVPPPAEPTPAPAPEPSAEPDAFSSKVTAARSLGLLPPP